MAPDARNLLFEWSTFCSNTHVMSNPALAEIKLVEICSLVLKVSIKQLDWH